MPEEKKYQTIRLAQLNVSHDETFPERLEKVIKPTIEKLNIDVITLQEVPNVSLTKKVFKELGFEYSNNTEDEYKDQRATFSKFEIIETNTLKLFKHEAKALHSKILLDNGLFFSVINTHLIWGEDKLVDRCLQVEQLNNLSKSFKDSDIIAMNGDFNSEETTRTIRFLTGDDLSIEDKEATYWMDAWKVAGKKDNWVSTSQSENKIIQKICHKFGVVHPEFIPDRRIDYIFIKGWNYGKLGHILSFETFGKEANDTELPLSDHFGLFADIVIE